MAAVNTANSSVAYDRSAALRTGRRARSRRAFTIVELLVSLALVLFIMTVLSEAFGAAATTFRNLKAIGDMCQKLRMASTMMRRDLAGDHFEGAKRLSDPNFWSNGPPREGYFRIYQDTNPTAEGHDLDNVWSYQSAHQILQFTTKFHGNERDDYFVGTVASNAPAPLSPTANGADSRYEDVNNKAGNLYQFRFTWAEVAYFLRPQVNPTSTTTQDTANGQPLFALYRRHWLSCVDNYSLNQSQRVPTITAGKKNMQFYLETSTMPDPTGVAFLYFNSPLDLTMPPRRMGTKTATGIVAPYKAYSPSATLPLSTTLLTIPTLAEDCVTYGATAPLTGADLLLPDVVSLDVRVLIAGNSDFVSIDDATVQAYASNNPNYNGATGKYLFDTWSSMTDDVYDFSNWAPGATGVNNTIPIYQNASGQQISVKAIQITLRIWDSKTEQSRQVTIVQEL